MRYNMTRYPKELSQRIRAKSGSMNNVRCYSGYILPADYIPDPGSTLPPEIKEKTIIFSIMTGNFIAPAWKVSPPIEKLMEALAQ
jgi:D-alanyl-D-alanine carboxypeptidase/D-alanyl-D-alanine-endopeptidase (penicillin-binding protein 4)